MSNPNLNERNNSAYTQDFSEIKAAELSRIGSTSNGSKKIGLAFSGGGIRSASFGLGFMQALVSKDKLEKIDYLSSVSGGGYLSSSLTWFLSQRDSTGQPQYGTSPKNFPFGQKNVGGKISDHTDGNAILNYIRQHGNYLIPGHGLNALSFAATVLRVIVGSFLIYFSLMVAFMFVLVSGIDALGGLFDGRQFKIGEMAYPMNFASLFFAAGVVAAVLFIGTSLWYSLATHSGVAKYSVDVGVQRRIGKYLKTILVFLVFAALPIIQSNTGMLIALISGAKPESDFVINGSLSISASVLGAILSFLIHRKQVGSASGISSLQIIASAVLLLFGLLLGAYLLADYLLLYLEQGKQWMVFAGYGACLVAIIYIGTHCNVNIFGLNRMYRDRLMETFMPGEGSVKSGRWSEAMEANETKVADMCQAPNQRPYHLINCNIILTESKNAKYRGRKGDSFTVSPLYCGSDATGWRKTNDYLKGKWRSGITLPTAMAISGAAANPNSGVAGKGPTTDKSLSLLMSILNLRLGFWAANPNDDQPSSPPNYINPGIQGSGFFGNGLNEEEKTVELSDGGHFENLAIYELLRRRLKLILVSDGGQDEDYKFADLGNAVEKARVDFGIKVVFDDEYSLEAVMPGSETQQKQATEKDYLLSKRGFALARIYYPKTASQEAEEGLLVYVKPALISEIGADVIAYKRAHSAFPNQSTIDQFFDEVQFEAYRELGYLVGVDMLDEIEAVDASKTSIVQDVKSLLC